MKTLYSIFMLFAISLNTFAVTAEKSVDKATATTAITEPMNSGNIVQMIIGLLFIVGLILGMAWFGKRWGSFQKIANGQLKIIGGLSLGQRERIVLVQAGDKQLLVGIAPGSINTLHVLDEPLDISDSPTHSSSGHKHSSPSFAERLNSILKHKADS